MVMVAVEKYSPNLSQSGEVRDGKIFMFVHLSLKNVSEKPASHNFGFEAY